MLCTQNIYFKNLYTTSIVLNFLNDRSERFGRYNFQGTNFFF